MLNIEDVEMYDAGEQYGPIVTSPTHNTVSTHPYVQHEPMDIVEHNTGDDTSATRTMRHVRNVQRYSPVANGQRGKRKRKSKKTTVSTLKRKHDDDSDDDSNGRKRKRDNPTNKRKRDDAEDDGNGGKRKRYTNTPKRKRDDNENDDNSRKRKRDNPTNKRKRNDTEDDGDDKKRKRYTSTPKRKRNDTEDVGNDKKRNRTDGIPVTLGSYRKQKLNKVRNLGPTKVTKQRRTKKNAPVTATSAYTVTEPDEQVSTSQPKLLKTSPPVLMITAGPAKRKRKNIDTKMTEEYRKQKPGKLSPRASRSRKSKKTWIFE